MTREELNAVRAFAHQLEQVVTNRGLSSRDGREPWRSTISEMLTAAQAGVDADEASRKRMVMP